MVMIVRAFPVVVPMSELNSFLDEVRGPRRGDIGAMYNRYGVIRESWHLQQTPSGPMVIGCTELQEPDLNAAAYAESTGEFETWFKGQVMKLSGVDAEKAPLGPETREVFSWSAEDAPLP